MSLPVSGQEHTGRPWYVPAITSINELAFRAGDAYEGISARTHADLSASWTAGPCDLFVEYDLVKKQLCGGKLTWNAASWLRLYAGIQKNPYILELSISPRNLEAVGYSQAASYLGGYGSDLSGISARGRDVGILAEFLLFPQQSRPVVRVLAGVFNGNGFAFIDNNAYKDFAGRLEISPVPSVTVSVGGMTGKYETEDGRLSSRSRLSGAFWYDDGHRFIRTENVYGVTDGLKTDIAHLLAGLWTGEHFSPSIRYEMIWMDTGRAETRSHIAAFCATWRFNPDINVRVQYDRRFFADGRAPYNQFAVGLNLRLAYQRNNH